MKRLVLVPLFLLFSVGLAFGSPLGPASPSIDGNQGNVGVGFFHYAADWDDFNFEQERAYLHLGYGMGWEGEQSWEIYLRAGAADLQGDGFDASYEPFGTVGMKGAFYEGPIFSWGLVLQASAWDDVKDADVEINNAWQAECGIPLQVNVGRPLALYAGPVFYASEADFINQFGEIELEEKHQAGIFGGIRWSFGPFALELEAQQRSDFSAGGMISIAF